MFRLIGISIAVVVIGVIVIASIVIPALEIWRGSEIIDRSSRRRHV